MQGGSHALTPERLFGGEFASDLTEDGHVARGPRDALLSTPGKRNISNITIHSQYSFH